MVIVNEKGVDPEMSDSENEKDGLSEMLILLNEVTKVQNEKEKMRKTKNKEISNLKLKIKLLTSLVDPTRGDDNLTNKNLKVKTKLSPLNYTNIRVEDRKYYVSNHPITINGARDKIIYSGFDMKQLRYIGTENVNYVDSEKPLSTILNLIYLHPDHLENRVLSHLYLNRQWIVFKYKNHFLSLHLEHDREYVYVMMQILCDNVETLLGRKYPNVQERLDATNQLLHAMDIEVEQLIHEVGNKVAYEMLPIWNKQQYDRTENHRWATYMQEKTYSQNELNISSWDKY